MQFNSPKFAAVVAAAKAKAANNAKWTRAIERAAAALSNNEIRVHLFGEFALVVNKSGEVYKVNGGCECKAAQAGHRECYHRAAVRLVEMLETAPAPAVEPKAEPTKRPVITRSIERDYPSGARVNVVKHDGFYV